MIIKEIITRPPTGSCHRRGHYFHVAAMGAGHRRTFHQSAALVAMVPCCVANVPGAGWHWQQRKQIYQ